MKITPLDLSAYYGLTPSSLSPDGWHDVRTSFAATVVIETDNVPTTTSQHTSLGGQQNNALDLKQQNTPQNLDLYLTAKEAARIARIHPVTLLRWTREGKVPHRRLSTRKVVFPLSQLNAWLSESYTVHAVRAA